MTGSLFFIMFFFSAYLLYCCLVLLFLYLPDTMNCNGPFVSFWPFCQPISYSCLANTIVYLLNIRSYTLGSQHSILVSNRKITHFFGTVSMEHGDIVRPKNNKLANATDGRTDRWAGGRADGRTNRREDGRSVVSRWYKIQIGGRTSRCNKWAGRSSWVTAIWFLRVP